MNFKKGIGPVVATALLLVVAVVSVVGFQGWFSSYSSSMFSDVEIKSNSADSADLRIDRLIDGILYVINNIEDNLSINKLEIGGVECFLNTNLSLGMNNLSVSDCVGSITTSTPDILLIAGDRVLEKQVYLKDELILSLYYPKALMILSDLSGSATFTDIGKSVYIDNLNNIYLSGYATGFLDFGNGVNLSQTGFFVTKYNSSGIAQWARGRATGVSHLYDSGDEIYVDSNQNVYLGGTFGSNADFGDGVILNLEAAVYGYYIVKYNSSGHAQWARSSQSGTGSQDSTTGIIVDSLDNVYLLGEGRDNSDFGNGVVIPYDGSVDFFLVKYDSSGNALWANTPVGSSGDSWDNAEAIFTDFNENIYIVGSTLSTNLSFGNGYNISNDGGMDFYMMKYNQSGDPLMLLTSVDDSALGSDYIVDGATDSLGNIYLAGMTTGFIDFGNNINITSFASEDFFVVKYNSSGVAQWVRTSESNTGVGSEKAIAISVDNFGNSFVVGETYNDLDFGNGYKLTHDGGKDMFIVKYDSFGNTKWAMSSYNESGVGNEYVSDVFVSESNGVFITGDVSSFVDFNNGINLIVDGNRDFFVVKFEE